jgi:hypothetical protein
VGLNRYRKQNRGAERPTLAETNVGLKSEKPCQEFAPIKNRTKRRKSFKEQLNPVFN